MPTQRPVFVLVALFVLAAVMVVPAAALQSGTCNLQINQGADAFSDAAALTSAGFNADDIRALVESASRRGFVDAADFFRSRGYDTAMINDFLSKDGNVALLNRLAFSSPSSNILSEAYALLANYGLPSGALVELYPLTSDGQALIDNLVARGLSPEQAASFAASAIDLADRATQAGVFQYAATLDGDAVLDRYNITNFSLYDLSPFINDPDALREELLRRGISADDAAQMTDDLGTLRDEQGMNSMYLNSWTTEVATYSLDYFGVPSDALLQLASLGDADAAQACLEAAGLDSDLLEMALPQFAIYLYGDEGNPALLTPEVIFDVALNDAGAFAAEYGLTGADLIDLSAYFGDRDALIAQLMSTYGLSADDAEFLASELENSIFADVFGEMPPEFEAVLNDSINAAENGEYYFAENIDALIDTDISQFEDESSGETTSGDDQGSSDQGGSDQGSGGDQSGGDQGGGDQGGGDQGGGDQGGGDQGGGDQGGGDTGGDGSGG